LILIRPILYFVSILIAFHSTAQATESVLASGKWFKISVQADGIYQIDYSFLKKLGADPDNINPTSIKLFGYPNGMLPQANSALRQRDLQEMAIMVSGEGDGKFSGSDKIFFYGQGPDAHYYDADKETFWYENHLYTDKNFYFITFDGSPGKRLTTLENTSGSFPIVNQYLDFAQFEEDKENILHSGREWFGFEFGSNTEATIQFDMSGVVENSPITLVSKVMARAYEPASFKVFYNNVEVGTQEIPIVSNSTYAAKGRMKTDTLRFNATSVGAAANSNQRIKYQFIKSGTQNSVGYHDNFLVSLQRKISLYGDQTIFTLTDGLANPQSTVEILSNSVDPAVWDVTDPFNIKNQSHLYTGGKAIFNTETNSIKRFAIFNSQKAMAVPAAEGNVANQNLQSISSAELLVIAHPDFLNEATRLAAHRLSNNELTSHIVTPQQIYNEYSGGKQDVSALRDFVRDVYVKSNSFLKYVLLFGRGSFDYKDRALNNSNYVPIYESRNSLSPLETYSSDDFFGFLEENEGEWSEVSSFDHTLEIGVGRLPVRTTEEAAAIVDKLIEYDTNPKAKGQWNTDIVFVADDGDFNVHQGQADQLSIQAETLNPALHAKKVYLDLYKQIQKPFGQISTEATNTLYRAFHEGALIVNFTGHGSEQLWMQERMLDPVFVATTQNRYQYPFLITATCEFGRNDDPIIISSAEKILHRKNAGAIGLVTTSRPVNSSTNFVINSDFYESFLNDISTKGKPIGTVFKSTKNRGNLGVSNRNFSLLGDPSMTLGLPQSEVLITELSNEMNESILKGLTKYTLSGEVRKEDQLQSGFNGEAEIRIFSKPEIKNTRGDENPVFQFNEHSRLLFQGKASVSSGIFEMEFTVPQLNEANPSTGKIIVYATPSDDSQEDAAGNFPVSISTVNNSLIDTSPPAVRLYINDTTFVNGGIANENPFFIAKIEDDNGIDISGIEERRITAILDGDSTFNLTSYFVSDLNNSKRGSIVFQMFNMNEGKHQIEFTVFDLVGNKSQATVDFVVGEQNQLEVSNFTGWPNPFSEKAKIGFFHNRSGEDLEGSITITNMLGEPVRSIEFESLSSFFSTEVMEWDGTDINGSKVASGIYILRLSVRSMADGSKNESFAKLILTN